MSPAAPHLISDDSSLERLVATLLSEPSYAIDTEFVRERTYHPELALVQIAWPGGLVLVDTLAASPRLLAPLFATDALAVVHAATQDLEILSQRVGSVPKRLFDTQIAGAFLGHGIASLATLLRTVLAVEISKSEQLTDWTKRPLSNSALAYAASDVRHLLELERALVEALESRGRIDWAQEECDRLLRRELSPRDPETAWWKLKGKSNLNARGQCVAQTVAAFREREAERRNVLPRFVLPDLVVMGIAQRTPKQARGARARPRARRASRRSALRHRAARRRRRRPRDAAARASRATARRGRSAGAARRARDGVGGVAREGRRRGTLARRHARRSRGLPRRQTRRPSRGVVALVGHEPLVVGAIARLAARAGAGADARTRRFTHSNLGTPG